MCASSSRSCACSKKRRASRSSPGAAVITSASPLGESYGRVENPKGELGYYVVSDGGQNPWRYHVRAPSFINLTALEKMCIGNKVADVVAILGSIDIVLGELDR